MEKQNPAEARVDLQDVRDLASTCRHQENLFKLAAEHLDALVQEVSVLRVQVRQLRKKKWDSFSR